MQGAEKSTQIQSKKKKRICIRTKIIRLAYIWGFQNQNAARLKKYYLQIFGDKFNKLPRFSLKIIGN